jgi:hypothetical protein
VLFFTSGTTIRCILSVLAFYLSDLISAFLISSCSQRLSEFILYFVDEIFCGVYTISIFHEIEIPEIEVFISIFLLGLKKSTFYEYWL